MNARTVNAGALPAGWSATVSRTWWGTWSAAGYYDGHQAGAQERPRLKVVSGWCWRRCTAIEQVHYWIQDAAAAYAAAEAWEASGEETAAYDTHEHDVALAQAYDEWLEGEHFRQLDWDAAIAEDLCRHDHGHAPVPEHSDQDDQDDSGKRVQANEEEGIEPGSRTVRFDECPHGKAVR